MLKSRTLSQKTGGVSLGGSGEEGVRIQLSASSRDNSVISDHIGIFVENVMILLPWIPEVFSRRAAGCFGVGHRPTDFRPKAKELRSRKTRMKSRWHSGYDITG